MYIDKELPLQEQGGVLNQKSLLSKLQQHK